MSKHLSALLLSMVLGFLPMPVHAFSSSTMSMSATCTCAYSDTNVKDVKKAKKKARRELEKAFFVGIFLFAFGLAAATVFALASSTLAVFRILLVVGAISLVVGDVLMCRYGQVCILRNVLSVLNWFWWL